MPVETNNASAKEEKARKSWQNIYFLSVSCFCPKQSAYRLTQRPANSHIRISVQPLLQIDSRPLYYSFWAAAEAAGIQAGSEAFRCNPTRPSRSLWLT